MESKEYFYVINYNSASDKELCDLEMKYIFNFVPEKKRYIVSNIDTNPSRSPFIKEKISIIFSGNSLESLVKQVVDTKLSLDDFKVIYLKSGDEDVDYKERLRSVSEIGYVITGEPNIHEPKVIVGISKIKDRWILGKYEKNDFKWHIHDRKPYTYSNSLGLKLAKSLVNVAVGNDFNLKVVDPCCGVGTVIIEALDIGINIKGYEINSQIADNAKKNLKFFGFENVVEEKDMHTIKENFDVAIIDMPYGIFTPTTDEKQNELIRSVARFAKKLVIVTIKNMDKELKAAGFKIVDKCKVNKNKFIRYITVCEIGD
ncbi:MULTISPECIES: methyltransferase domain-containing protein [Clostridium]|uniref:SAM-dependent methyltransferase n=1 Tax=Clostridium cibarium TaxID=2762247 RepID=A0ABR8PW71_9CLOT|nr:MULTISPECIES: methyltransferase domain-containing protein [Clostridium]MBD7912432.1 SAM-dependent methyltransferase [Clostridium cibarium]